MNNQNTHESNTSTENVNAEANTSLPQEKPKGSKVEMFFFWLFLIGIFIASCVALYFFWVKLTALK
jgi:hypothetical protein